jgi:very-long-chain enoyl-CoA reductase
MMDSSASSVVSPLRVFRKTVFHIEYFGPIVMHALCFFLPELVYGQKVNHHSYTQTVAFWLVVLHYVKREYETHFVHRFSNATMPFMNVFKNSAHYWLLGGLFIAYFIYHPQYTEFHSHQTVNILAAMFLLFELGNYVSHMQLRNLRAPGTRERKNPRGLMFEYTSCANYTFEVFAWAAFSVMVWSLPSWLFLAVSTAQIAQWSIKKHKLLNQEFGRVPGRKILFPFLW